MVFDHLTLEMGWPGGPVVPVKPGEPQVKVTMFPVIPGVIADVGRTTQLMPR